jgi:hypothetical protein
MLNDAEQRLARPISPPPAVEPRPATTPAVRAPAPDTQEHAAQETREIGTPPRSLATPGDVAIQQPKQQARKGMNYVHLLLTVVTGGGWLPIWIIYGLCHVYLVPLTKRGWTKLRNRLPHSRHFPEREDEQPPIPPV